MNGASPPDRDHSLGLSTLQGWTRAQMPCLVSHAKILKKDKQRAAPVVARHRVACPSSSACD